METGVIVLAHGSKRQETKETFQKILDMLKAKGDFAIVEEAYLQFCKPDLEDAISKLVNQGIFHIVVVPYFLFKGLHNTEDIPAELAEMRKIYPQLEISFGEPLGADPRLADILVERIKEVNSWNS